MNAATEAFHAALQSACGFSVQDEARRIIAAIERAHTGTTPYFAAYGAIRSDAQGTISPTVWRLVDQHFRDRGYTRYTTPATQPEQAFR